MITFSFYLPTDSKHL